MAHSELRNVAYILAASHSGSTILAMLLNAHPDVVTVGELKATNLGDVTRYRCSCGKLISECRFWASVSEAMAKRGILFDIADARTDFRAGASAYTRWLLGPLHRGRVLERIRDAALALSPSWRSGLRCIQQRNLVLVETVCELTGVHTIVDSSKVGLRLKYLLRNPGLDVKVIRLVRDGRAVALTYTDPTAFADAQDPCLRGGGAGDIRPAETLSFAQAARAWRRCNEDAENVLATLPPSRWTSIRYEDLCASPRDALAGIFRFLGSDPGKAAVDFRSVEHHILGNGMRLDSTSEVRLDERWKSVLTEDDLRLFEPVAGDLNRRYGYV
jgi:hypothetical protein